MHLADHPILGQGAQALYRQTLVCIRRRQNRGIVLGRLPRGGLGQRKPLAQPGDGGEIRRRIGEIAATAMLGPLALHQPRFGHRAHGPAQHFGRNRLHNGAVLRPGGAIAFLAVLRPQTMHHPAEPVVGALHRAVLAGPGGAEGRRPAQAEDIVVEIARPAARQFPRLVRPRTGLHLDLCRDAALL